MDNFKIRHWILTTILILVFVGTFLWLHGLPEANTDTKREFAIVGMIVGGFVISLIHAWLEAI